MLSHTEVAPGHENAFPEGRPNVLAIVDVFPEGETLLATLRSFERISVVSMVLLLQLLLQRATPDLDQDLELKIFQGNFSYLNQL